MTKQTPLNFAIRFGGPSSSDQVKARILELASEMHELYRSYMLQSTGKTCDICGHGDHDEYRRVRDVVPGYEHRESESPVLCSNHFIGWTNSLRILGRPGAPDELVNLHFAQFVAKHLVKAAARKVAL